MREEAYRKRLTADVRRWREQGWVTENGAAAILSSLPKRQHWAVSWVTILGTLGGLLLGAGLIAFVSANWEVMPRVVRLALLIGGLAGSYLVGAILLGKGHRLFADIALLVAGFAYAGTIAFVAQTYHLSGDVAGAVFLWVVGMYGAALLTASPAMTVMVLVGSGYWTWLGVEPAWDAVHWNGLVAILVGVGLAIWLRAGYARLVAALALGFWLVLTLIAQAHFLDWPFRAAMAAVAAVATAYWAVGAALTGAERWTRLAEFGRMIVLPALAALLVALGLMQIGNKDPDRPVDPFWQALVGWQSELWLTLAAAALIVAIAVGAVALRARRIGLIDLAGAVAIGLAAMIYAYWYPDDVIQARLAAGLIVLAAALFVTNLGQTGPLEIGKKLGLAAFGIEIIYLYVVTLGTVMDTAIAFLIGGVLFIALAYGLYQANKRLTRRAEAVE